MYELQDLTFIGLVLLIAALLSLKIWHYKNLIYKKIDLIKDTEFVDILSFLRPLTKQLKEEQKKMLTDSKFVKHAQLEN